MTTSRIDRPVVVGVDGTEGSLKALDWAADHAVEHNCPLRIVHVSTGREPSATTVRLRAFGRLALRTGHRPTATSWRLRFGSRPAVLAEEAADARLLVLGHREPQPYFGSTLRGLLARGVGEVVVVPASWSDPAPFRRVVVGVKGDDTTDALQAALKIAADRHSALRVVDAVELPAVHQGVSLLEATRRLEVKTKAKLAALLAGSAHPYREVPVEWWVNQGDPARLLTRAARDADLLVITGHPRHLPPTMTGTVTESILRQVNCPVIITRSSAAQRRQPSDAA